MMQSDFSSKVGITRREEVVNDNSNKLEMAVPGAILIARFRFTPPMHGSIPRELHVNAELKTRDNQWPIGGFSASTFRRETSSLI
jgi:hypothetical protein